MIFKQQGTFLFFKIQHSFLTLIIHINTSLSSTYLQCFLTEYVCIGMYNTFYSIISFSFSETSGLKVT